MNVITRLPTYNINHRSTGPGLVSIGGMTAVSLRGRCLAPEEIAANGPAGTSGSGGSDIVDVSGISPDQQFQAGLFCGSVRPTPPTPANPAGIPISSALGVNLCPASQYGSHLVKIPAPDTEDDDRNPPRIQPRNLFDIALGDDNVFHGDRFKWSARITVINIANQYSLYNFLSTFSGTHYVTPRSITGQIGFHF